MNRRERYESRHEERVKRHIARFYGSEQSQLRRRALAKRLELDALRRAASKGIASKSQSPHLESFFKKPFKLYKAEVWRITRAQPLHSLIHFDKRGWKDYHIDHKFSIYSGFRLAILPEIIGSLQNLEMRPSQENLRKGRRCSVSVSQLLFQVA